MDKQIWHEVHFSEWSPRITERLVVKETMSMVTYETTSRHWHTRALRTHLNKSRKRSEGHEFFQSREDAIGRLRQWATGRADYYEGLAQSLRDAASAPTIEHLNTDPI